MFPRENLDKKLRVSELTSELLCGVGSDFRSGIVGSDGEKDRKLNTKKELSPMVCTDFRQLIVRVYLMGVFFFFF